MKRIRFLRNASDNEKRCCVHGINSEVRTIRCQFMVIVYALIAYRSYYRMIPVFRRKMHKTNQTVDERVKVKNRSQNGFCERSLKLVLQ